MGLFGSSADNGKAKDTVLVSVDVGRSAVKSVWAVPGQKSSAKTFVSKYALGRTDFSRSAQLKPSADKWYEVQFGGVSYLLGETAEQFGTTVLEVSEGSGLIEFAKAAILYSIGLAVNQTGCSKVMLAINLTYSNYFQKSQYQEMLKNERSCLIGPEENQLEISFSIEKIFVLYQGYSALMKQVLDSSSLNVREEFRSSTGIVIDIGRRTVDISVINSLAVREGQSYDVGTVLIFSRAAQILQSEFDLSLLPSEIEHSFLVQKKMYRLDGKQIDLESVVRRAVEERTPEVESTLKVFLASSSVASTPDFILLTGGGAELFFHALQKVYPRIEKSEDATFANADGMLLFLRRVVSEQS